MALRKVPVDLDQLEWALTDQSGTRFYLDAQTGDLIPADALDEDEAEELEADEGRYVYIQPLRSRVEYDLMVEFTRSVANQRLKHLLDVALNGWGAFRRFNDVLTDFPTEREAWFAFRNEAMRQVVLEWLDEHELEPAE